MPIIMLLFYFLIAVLVLYAIYLILGLVPGVIPENVRKIIVLIIFIFMLWWIFENRGTVGF